MPNLAPAYPFLRAVADGVVVSVQVQPGARHSEVAGLHGERLKLCVKAPPLDGRANEAVVALVAGWVKLAPSKVRLCQGEHSRAKQLFVPLTLAQMTTCLQPLLAGKTGKGPHHE